MNVFTKKLHYTLWILACMFLTACVATPVDPPKPEPEPNTAPSVELSITSPQRLSVDGVLTDTAAIIISATVSDVEDNLESVELKINNQVIGTNLSTAPFEWKGDSLNGLSAGTHSITVTATDTEMAASSKNGMITITQNQAPSVSFSNITPNQEFPFGSNVDITLTATDSDGSINSTELILNGASLGTKEMGNLNWLAQDIAALNTIETTGAHQLEAKTWDNEGAEASASTSFIINEQPPQMDERPNIVIVITDDQGHGDLGIHGHPSIKTPNIDALARSSVNLTDYHVSPTCSPTRAAFLTGRVSNRTGVWHTINGRSMLRENEVTIADILKESGYRTAMFGKWHLGDNYPYRPEDRGFETAYYHGGGGVGQTPDIWNNAYFDDTYFRNGTPEPSKGYVTDVLFNETIKFIDSVKDSGSPFFTYVATNAPHEPFHSPNKYSSMYPGQNNTNTKHFWGMITNIDDNVARLRKHLTDNNLADNTIFIFTTDNGSVIPTAGNSGMRGNKGSEYDGGHRVPFFMYWPAGGLTERKNIPDISAHIDVLPTLLNYAGVKLPDEIKIDGTSLKPLIDDAYGKQAINNDQKTMFDNRIIVTDSQRVTNPRKWKQTAVMTKRWRLVNGNQLFDIQNDPGQKNNIANGNQGVVNQLTQFYNGWWDDIAPTFGDPTSIYVGNNAENPSHLTAHDWLEASSVPWHQGHIRQALGDNQAHKGYWSINVEQAGDYEIELRRWPEKADRAIRADLQAAPDVPGQKAYRAQYGKPFPATQAHLELREEKGNNTGGPFITRQADVNANAKFVKFTVNLTEGKIRLMAKFTHTNKDLGAYFVTVRRL